MAYDLTKFTDFIGRENEVLTSTLFAGGDTAKIARYMTGIKGSTEVPKISGKANIQKGTCNTPNGSTAGDLVKISVEPFTVYESFCADDLQTKFPNMVLAPGSNNADTPKEWEEALIEVKISDIAEQLELLYWQGDTTGTDHTLFDGFLKKIDAAGAINGNTSGATEITKDNVKGLVEDMRTAAPAKVKRHKDFVIAVGDDVFDLYIQAEKEDNLYHYKPEHDEGTYRIGGSGATLQRVYGLDDQKRMVATIKQNLIIGSDLENEHAVADMWYDKTSDLTYFRVKAKVGVQIDNATNEIVEFTLSAE